MSALIRTAILLIRDRLGRYITEATTMDFTVDARLTDPEKITRIKVLINAIKTCRNKIVNVLNELEKKDDKWVDLVQNLDEEARMVESATYEGFARGGAGFLNTMEHAREVLDQLDENLRAIQDLTEGGEPTIAIAHQNNRTRGGTTKSLPKQQLEHFSGDSKNWQSFMEDFTIMVDEQNLSDREKLSFLKKSLRGDAYDLIKGYPLEAANYRIVMDRLKENYGNKNAVKGSLQSALRKIPRASAKISDVRKTIREVDAIRRQLEQLGENTEQFTLEIESKLPRWLLAKVFKKKENDDEWTLEKMMLALDEIIRRAETLNNADREFDTEQMDQNLGQNKGHLGQKMGQNFGESSGNNWGQNSRQSFSHQRYRKPPPVTAMYAIKIDEQKGKITCFFCNGTHYATECPKYKSQEERSNRAKEGKLCFKCLRSGHDSRSCKRQKTCFICKGTSHHQALCRDKDKKEPWNRGNKDTEPKKSFGQRGKDFGNKRVNICTTYDDDSETESIHVTCVATKGKDGNKEPFCQQTLLPNAMVAITNPEIIAKIYEALAFLDGGSEMSFITIRQAIKMGLKPYSKEIIRMSVFTGKKYLKKLILYEYNLMLKSGEILKVIARGVEKITDAMHTVKAGNIKELMAKRSLPTNYVEPEILIGQDYLNKIVKTDGEMESGYEYTDSKIGPIISGRGKICLAARKSISVVKKVDDKLTEEEIKNFWNLEAMGITDCPLEKDDEVAKEYFLKTVKRLKDGRYEVSWPLIEAQPEIQENYWIALNRLKSMYTKLAKTPDLLKKYDHIFKQQLENGIIEKVEKETKSGWCSYLPHHPVIKLDKSSTKIRPVMEANCRAKGGKSVNENLLRGPVMLPDLAGTLLRFRLPKIAITGDIAKAFHNVSVTESQRDLTRFLWLKDWRKPPTEDNIQILRHAMMCMGVVSAPFLLGAVIEYHMKSEATPVAIEIKENIYADNAFLGAKTENEAVEKSAEAKQLFQRAKMDLRDFGSNCKKVNELFSDDKERKCMKILGLNWDMESDNLEIKIGEIKEQSEWTKRKVLKEVAKIFDPLGLITPVTLPRKVFFQQLWKKGYGWDEALKKEDMEEWKILMTHGREKFSFPRRVLEQTELAKPVELHIFVDSSAKAYCTVAYIREELPTGKVNVALIYAKNRLCPVKSISMPRLELLAALTGARMAKFIKKEMKCPISTTTVWGDSKCVLSWIANKETVSLPKFVKNRVEEIKKEKDIEWRYINTRENPADLGTRGCTLDELKEFTLWQKAPKWLSKRQSEWPAREEFGKMDLTEKDEELESFFNETKLFSIRAEIIKSEVRNDWTQLVTISSMALKFLKKISKNIKFGTEILAKLQKAKTNVGIRKIGEILLIHQAQIECPPDDKTKKDLGLVKNEMGIWRCTGRIGNSDLTESQKYPIFLPREAKATKLICGEYHKRAMHSGVQQSLSELRVSFWVPKGRFAMKEAIKDCLECKRERAQPFRLPVIPALPKERVTKSDLFERCGVDYFGPLIVKTVKNEQIKIWVALFTCFVSRSVHLEIVECLSTESFIQALRRFVAEYGRPKLILSDNGSQFVLAAKVLRQIEKFTEQEKIVWRFIPQLTPWAGGMYERLVAVTKRALKAAAGIKMLKLEEFRTILAEVKTVVNSRPLTYLNEGLDSGTVIRPIDLIQPSRNQENFEVKFEDEEEYTEKISPQEKIVGLWKNNMKNLDKFWEKFHFDYLQSLRERYQTEHKQKRGAKKESPTVGSVVIIHEKGVPRGLWRTGIIQEQIASTDGEVRAVKVKVGKGKPLIRSIAHLYPLEIEPIGEDIGDPNLTAKEQNSDGGKRKGEKTQSAKNKKIPVQKEKENKPRAHPMTLRTRAKAFLTLALVIIMAFGKINGMPCGSNQELTIMHTQTCMREGLAISRTKTGNLCWEHIKCTRGHLREAANANYTAHCGPSCRCPAWAKNQCSFYEGPSAKDSTQKDPLVAKMLEEEKPEFCSLTPDKNCEENAKIQELNQIELFDGSKHLVKELRVNQLEVVAEEYKCVGTGTITGSSLYCKNYHCDPKGTKLCYYAKNEIAKFISDHGNVAIKAWGKIPVKIYGYKEKTPNCKGCEIECGKEGIKVKSAEKLSGIELCANEKCFYTAHPKEIETFALTLETLVNEQEITTKFWQEGVLVKEIGRNCPARKHCELIDCVFCWQLLTNVHCSPKVAMVLLAIVIYLAGNFLLTIGRLVRCCANGLCCLLRCKLRLIRHIARKRQPKGEKAETAEKLEMLVIDRNERRLPMKVVIALTVSLIVCRLPLGTSLATITAEEEQCVVDKMGQRTCVFEHVLDMAFRPNEQTMTVIMNDHNGKPSGTLTLETGQVRSKCVKVAKFWTRSFEMTTISSKRCLGAGTCQEMRCSGVKKTDWIPELESANHMPGITGCMESCGGLFCAGCFHSAPACLFYRYFADPKTSDIYALFECPSWEREVSVNVTLTTSNEVETGQIILRSGLTSAWNHLKVTTKALSTEPMPILNRLFLTNGRATALIERDKEPNWLSCSSPKAAKELNCTLDQNVCSCHAADEMVTCNCIEGDTVETLLKDYPLPSLHNGILIKEKHRDIVAVLESTGIEIQLKFSGMALTTQIELNTCDVTPGELKGCYECDRGATISLRCRTDFGRALAQIVCPSTTMAIPCSPKEGDRTLSLHFTRAEIDEECEVFCPAATTKFHLRGALAFAETPVDDYWTTVKRELHIDWKPILKSLFFDPLNLAIFSVSLISLIVFFYLCLPIALDLLVYVFTKGRRSVANIAMSNKSKNS